MSNAYWHTGKYDIATDKFIGGGVACFGPDGRVIEAKTASELARLACPKKP